MFLRHFIPQINRIFLLPGEHKRTPLECFDLKSFKTFTKEYCRGRCCLLDLFGVFVADKNDNRINVNAVESLNSMWADVEQTVTALD